MGAIPNKLPGFQDIENDAAARAQFEARLGRARSRRSTAGTSPQMFEAMERGELTRALRASARTRRSPRPTSDARRAAARRARLPRRAGHLPDEDRRARRRRASRRRPRWCETEGTVTNSERRVQRVRKALDAARRGARRHLDHLRARAPARPRLGPTRRRGRSGTSCARSRPMHARHELRAARGARRPPVAVPRRDASRARRSCTGGSGSDPVRRAARAVLASSSTTAAGRRARRASSRCGSPPAAGSSRTTPACRRARYALAAAPRRDARPLARGRRAARRRRRRARARRLAPRQRSRRRCASTRRCAPGLAFMTFHFPDQVDTNLLTIDATDPKSGTAEFKAAAIRVEKLAAAEPAGAERRAAAMDLARPRRRAHRRPSAPRVDAVLGAARLAAGRAAPRRRRPATDRPRVGGRPRGAGAAPPAAAGAPRAAGRASAGSAPAA